MATKVLHTLSDRIRAFERDPTRFFNRTIHLWGSCCREEYSFAIRVPLADKADVHTTVDLQIKREKRVSELIHLLPPISTTLSQLLGNLAGQDCSIPELTSLIERDASLASHVLRVVNSALYARRGEICSVAHAICLLGTDRLRNIALSLSVSRMVSASTVPRVLAPDRFNRHSLATAMMSDLVAQRVRTNYAEGAFAAGLLHGIGKLVIGLALQKEYELFLFAAATSEASIEEVEKEWIGLDHREISGIALRKWNLPPDIHKAVTGFDSEEGQSGTDVPLGLVLQASHRAVLALGIDAACCPRNPEGPTAEEILGGELKCRTASHIVDEFQKHFDLTSVFA